jgi:hypothetical protein
MDDRRREFFLEQEAAASGWFGGGSEYSRSSGANKGKESGSFSSTGGTLESLLLGKLEIFQKPLIFSSFSIKIEILIEKYL